MGENISPAYRILTSRLVLRCWEPKDAALLKEATDKSREHLKPWMPWANEGPEALETTIQKLRSFRGQFDMNENYVYGIFNKDESQVLGGTGLHPRVGEGGIEIGYWIHVDSIGKGLATETAGALTRVGFEIHHLDRVEIHCDPANIASAAIPPKLGFQHEATLLRRMKMAEDVWRDTMVWTLFASNYPQSPAAVIEIEAFDVVGNKILFSR
jgi:RimJ/RimL family protein N-acetyltransferase